MLTYTHKRKRNAFARKHWRLEAENLQPLRPRYVAQTVQKPQGLMVWAAINGHGQLVLRRCPLKVNAVEYQKIIDSTLRFVRPRYLCK